MQAVYGRDHGVRPAGPSAALPPDSGILRERIESGELELDRPIPSEVQIQQEFGVARETARHAVALLRDEGHVVTVPGMGTYVKAPRQRG